MAKPKTLTIDEFLKALKLATGAEPKAEELYIGYLERFSPNELGKIFDHLMETYDRVGFPKIATILNAGHALGFPRPHNPSLEWTPTDCPFCGGSGMVAVITLDGRQMHAGPYQDSTHIYEQNLQAVRNVCRCPCGANRGSTGGLPLFRGVAEPLRVVQVKPVVEDFRQGKTRDQLKAEFCQLRAKALAKMSMPGSLPRQIRRQREPGEEDEETA